MNPGKTENRNYVDKTPLEYMGVEPKIGFFHVFSPQIIHLFIGFGTIIFTIHFGLPLFLETPICRSDFGRGFDEETPDCGLKKKMH